MQFLLSFLQICATEGYESQVADEENRSDTLGAPEAGSCLSVEEAPVGPGLLLAVERSSLCLCVGLRPCGGSQPLPQPHLLPRKRLNAFRDREAAKSSWAWLVQGTGKVTGHGFKILTLTDTPPTSPPIGRD